MCIVLFSSFRDNLWFSSSNHLVNLAVAFVCVKHAGKNVSIFFFRIFPNRNHMMAPISVTAHSVYKTHGACRMCVCIVLKVIFLPPPEPFFFIFSADSNLKIDSARKAVKVMCLATQVEYPKDPCRMSEPRIFMRAFHLDTIRVRTKLRQIAFGIMCIGGVAYTIICCLLQVPMRTFTIRFRQF